MKILLALLMGLLSGFLIYMMVFMSVAPFSSLAAPSPGVIAVVALIFFAAWWVSTWVLLRGAQTTSRVLSRGLLLGAAEWFAMILVGVILSGRTATSLALMGDSSEFAAGAAIGSGIGAFMIGGASIFMALVCLLGFLIVHLTTREMKEERLDLRKCPMCAELIQPEARRCRYCGADLNIGASV